MKVLRVINDLRMGGAERSLETNVPVHIKNGIEMDILVMNPTKTEFYNNLVNKGVKIYSTGGRYSLYNPLHIFKIIPFLKKYDIVHVHSFPPQYWVVIAKIISFSKTKLVLTEHSTENRRRKYMLLRLIDKWNYKHYDHIITISDACTKNLIEEIGPNHVITQIMNGVSLDPFFEVKNKIKLVDDCSSNVTILTQIASFRKAKDQKTVIRSLLYLNEHVHLVLVGEGDSMPECKQLAQEIGVNERVHFLGKRGDIPEIVNSSDIIIMSSIYEGFGRAAVEGMAGRKPVIASDVPGMDEVVRGAGILFPVGNSEILASEINKLINSKPLYEKVANACYERSKTFDAKIMIASYEKVYRDVLNQ